VLIVAVASYATTYSHGKQAKDIPLSFASRLICSHPAGGELK